MTDRILGMDLGSKRIGIAISDPLNLTAQPLHALRFSTPEILAKDLNQLIEQYRVQKVVVGLPLNMNASEGPAAVWVRKITENLSQLLSIEFCLWDERLSTRSAERVLIEGNVRRKARREVIDSLAAVIILQGFLDRLNLQRGTPG